MPPDAHSAESIDAGARAVRDTPHLAEAIRELADADRRWLLHPGISRSVTAPPSSVGPGSLR